MKRSFLSKLRTNGVYYITGALLLLIGVPLYQLAILGPEGYGNAISAAGEGAYVRYLLWLNTHLVQFLGYRVLLIIAFAFLFSLPFTLFRIIVAQELLGMEDENEENIAESEGIGRVEGAEDRNEIKEDEAGEDAEAQETTDGMPPYAWRGRGFAILAAWGGLGGIIFAIIGTLLSTLYLFITGSDFNNHMPVPGSFATLSGTFDVLTYTVGGGLLALACLFFGAIIARRGRNLWPGIWVAFGYLAIATAALLSGSAVAVVSAPAQGQAALTTPAILLFALWVLWLGIMLVRLKPEN